MSFTNYLAKSLLDHIFTDSAFSPPATLYLALSTTTPTEAGGNFTEPSGNNYSRVSTAAADWSAATSADPSVKANSAQKDFPEASGSWGTVTYFGLWDDSSAGNLMAFGALTTSKTIGSGDVARFKVGDLSLSLD